MIKEKIIKVENQIKNRYKALEIYKSMDFDEGDQVTFEYKGENLIGRIICYGDDNNGDVHANIQLACGKTFENIDVKNIKKPEYEDTKKLCGCYCPSCGRPY